MASLFRRSPLVGRLMHLYWRFSRPLTMGVRGMVLDGEGRVFLVKHSYVDGWHMPGCGVEVGETVLEALKRELVEEGSIELTGAPALHGIYFNPVHSRRDQVALYGPGFPAERTTGAGPGDHRSRLLSGGRASGWHHGRHARAYRRSPRRHCRYRGVVAAFGRCHRRTGGGTLTRKTSRGSADA